MRKSLFLHIGAHKTATTYLQNTFALNADLLAQHGLLYPEPLLHQAHHSLARTLKSPEMASMALEDIPMWGKLLSAFDRAPQDRLLLSSEDFEWQPNLERLAPLHARYDVKIIFYLRAPDDYLESYYNQLVKDFNPRESRTLEQFIADKPLHFLQPNLILDRWAEVFGTKNIIVRLFRKDQMRKMPVTYDLLKAIGQQTMPDLVPAETAGLHKVSLPPDALEYLRLCNPHFDKVQGHHAFVTNLAEATKPHYDALQRTRAGLLSIDAKKTIRKRFQHNYQQVAQKYLGSSGSPFPIHEATPHINYEKRLPTADVAMMAFVAALQHT